MLVDSCDALRTVVEEHDGIPIQRVLPQAPAMLDVRDFSEYPDAEMRARTWIAGRCETPLDWHRALYQSTLIKIGPKYFVWYLNVHHMIFDGWSFELIYRRMAELYRASLEGHLPERADLPAFADYQVYERAYRRSSRHRKAEAYWSELLAEPGEIVNFYGKLPLRMTTKVRRISQELGSERTKKLKSVAAAIAGGSEALALFDAFAAMLVGYLYCLNGSETYTIGVPVHNRRSQSVKQTIGFFSEVLPVRVTLAEDETFASLSKKISAEVRRTLRHGQHPVTNPFFKRLYDVTLNYHTSSFSEFDGIPARPEWVHNGHGDESLGIQIQDFASSNSLAVDFDLHEGIFDEQDGGRVVAHFFRVVDAFLLDPGQPVRRLSLMSQHERERLLVEWNNAAAEQAEPLCVCRLFEEQARERPDAVAVLQADERLTYGDLNCRANALAQLLRSRGAGPETPIGVYLTRSSEMVVALMGVHKTGAAYVPIDPQYSSEWLKFILEDTGAPILLTQGNLLGKLPQISTEVICLDDPAQFESGPCDNLGISAVGDDLAYIIYTSGSSGTPKGVEITHRALANFASEAARVFELNSSDRVLQFASISFDTSVEEIFPCLTRGATLVLRSDSMLDSTPAFLEQCRDWGITVLDLPTAYWHELTATLFSERRTLPESLRLVVIGGERAITERMALWQACVGEKVRLINTYGPTETTVVSTVCDLTHTQVQCGVAAEVAIGRPIAHVQTLVLDQNLTPVPEGVPGELYIGGVGLARGYLGRTDLTAEKFIPNPFESSSGARLYKTGDIVRYRDDGNLEFLRRCDDQVKVRGFRVELEGIASVLRQHPLIRDAAVTQEAARNTGRLVAYVVPEGAGVLNLTEIQNFVKTKLPEYMVPAVLIPLDSLPLTARGKVDRRALPLPRDIGSAGPEKLTPPQTLTERRIADIWCELLSLPMVGRDQHFFELGGHSLLAAQVVARIRREWQVEISLRAIFEAPTIALLAERVEQVLRHAEPAPLLTEAAPSMLRSHNGKAPASDSQLRIWYMDQFAPESSAYNITAAIRFTGSFDRLAFERSLDQLVERHESLRTTVQNVGGQPMQVIGSALHLELPEIDLRTMPDALRLDEAKRIIRDDGKRPFDLSRGPLLRLLLLRLHDEDHVLLLTMHHVISDQWSLGVIAREISFLYNGFRNGAEPTLNAMPAQYGDFAVWQDRWLTPDRLQAELSYWKKQLSGVLPSAFPTDYPRPPTQTFQGAHQSVRLSQNLVESLRKLAFDENATLYMVFLAVFKILLCRYSGHEDVAIGSPVANRSRSEWESVIGTFINILVLRTDLSGNPSLRQVVRRVRETVLDGFTHQDLPFQKLVEELVPGRDASRGPLVQVLFNFQSTPLGKTEFDGMSWAPLEIDQWAAQFDVSVTIDPEITRKIFVSYNTDLYDAATITRILGHYERLLEAAAANAEQSLASAARLLVVEHGQGLALGEDLQLAYPECCVHELFEAQASRTPDAVAVMCQDRQISYGDLNERSDQLARRLRTLGVGPEKLVGIALERSPELIIGILAILKAGGAYVPLDPAYPPERIAFICEDSSIAALLTQRNLLQLLPKKDLPILCLDEMAEAAGQQKNKYLDTLAHPDHLAYVIYTSGSTGTPKGVEISHRALMNFLHSMKRRPGLDASDVFLSVTTISFDIAALELFLPLITGARVVLASREVSADGKRLIDELVACGASVMQATPTTWRLMIEAGWQPSSDIKVLCGGEGLPLSLAQALTARNRSIWNLYGPTETTVWSSIWPVETSCERVCIGRPIDNTEIYVLDSSWRPVPVGVPGELYIGGEGLARGYLLRPELTAEKFVPNPFGTSSSRLYRTGDLGRYLPDGNIELIGRLDNQVKVRGFRIELGEIEVALSGHEAVKEAVVVVGEEEAGTSTMLGAGKRLVAYVVLNEGRTLTEKELIGYLKKKLPNFMVPSAFMFLESLPLTPNGKIDRRGLPAVEAVSRITFDFTAPHTAIEEIIEGVWRQVLNLKRVSIHENFFDLGGHSLLATQVISRLRDAFQRDLPLRAIFEAPTIAELAAFIEVDLGGDARKQLPPLTKVSAKNRIRLSFAQERLWFLNQLQPDLPAYNISLAVQIAGALDMAALEQSLREIVRRHEVLRASFPLVDGRPAQVVSVAGPTPISVVDLTDAPQGERESRALQCGIELVQRPFDLARGPLLRLALLRLDDANHVLVFVVHHIVFDARSAEIFLRELVGYYKAVASGEALEVSEPPVHYADYAAWQRTSLQGEFIERQIAYWKRQLEGFPSMIELPTDRSRPSVKTYRGTSYSWTIAAPTGKALGELSRGANVTLFMSLLAAFNVLLHRYSGQDDIVVGTPISNRTAVETEAMIGLFINTLALRTDLSGNPSFRQLLRRVRETALGAYTHQDLPFEQLLHHIRLERQLAYTPLFQVMFAFQTKPAQALEIAGLRLRPIEMDHGTAKFDLTLSVVESGDEIHAAFEYDTDLFDRDRVERMAGHFETLLQDIIEDPDRRLSDLMLLNEAERAQILNQWSVSQNHSAEPKCIHRLFECQVEKTPDRIAVVCGDKTWTYRQVNERANQLAHHLRSQGVGPNCVVGINLKSSFELIVGIFGVLKAGGAYMPLDPGYPLHRLKYMIDNANASLLITAGEFAERWQPSDRKVVCLDVGWPEIAKNSDKNPAPVSGPGNLIYVIYTSGSTGRPKGAGVYHQGFSNLLEWFTKAVAISANDRLLLVSSPSFDLTQKNIFAALLVGGELHLPPDIHYDPDQIANVISDKKITLLNLTPSAFYPLIERGIESDKLRTLRVVFLGGEPIAIPRVRRWLERESCRCEIINTYGPTECTDVCAFYRLNLDNIDSHPVVPIGRPISNARLLVLDPAMQLCPAGMAGELSVAGDGVGAGYIGDSELTAMKFVPNPFAQVPGERIYKTGDRARYLFDGNIEFLGRTDQQVKLRGFRIDLGEVEKVLEEHDSIDTATVVVWHGTHNGAEADDRRLVGYVVPKRRTALSSAELCEFLRGRLPDYMVPAAFVQLDELPLLLNGKIDRRALPAPEGGCTMDNGDFPSGRLEFQLIRLWRMFLGVNHLGLRDNFFDLGGDSLRAASLIAAVEKNFGKKIRLIDFFAAPTVTHLAALLRESGYSTNWSSLIPIQPRGSKPPFFWVHGDGSNFLLPAYLGQDQPVYGFMHQCQDGMPARYTTVQDIATHYLEELCSVQPDGPYLLGGYSFGGLVAFEMAQQLLSRGESVGLLVLLEATLPYTGVLSSFSPINSLRTTDKVRSRLRDQLARLQPLTAVEAVVSLQSQIKGRFKQMFEFRRTKRAFQRIIYKFCELAGYRVPRSVRTRYLLDVYDKAVRRYRPNVYPGDAVFIKTVKNTHDHLGAWGNLASQGLKVHLVPGDHKTAVDEPQVKAWAEKLKDCLDKAQADLTAKTSLILIFACTG